MVTLAGDRNAAALKYLFLALGAAILWFLLSGTGWADNMANPNYVIEEMRDIVSGYTPKLLRYARNLFVSLATISLAIGMIQMILSGESNLGSVAAHLTRWIVYVGFFMWVMGGQAFFIPHLVVESFVEAATEISGSQIMPGDVLEYGISIFGSLMATAHAMGWKEVIVAGLSGIVLILVFAVLAAIIACTLIEMYIVVCGGSILLGFAGVEFTRDIAISYLKYSVSVGVKLLTIMIIAAVARDMCGKWAASLGAIGDGEFFAVVGYLLGGSVTLTLSAFMIPNIAQGIISGTSLATGGMLRNVTAAPALAAGAGARSIATGASNTAQAMRNYRQLNPEAGSIRGTLGGAFQSGMQARSQGASVAGSFAAAASYAAGQGKKSFETASAGAKYVKDSAVFGSQSWQAAQHLGRKEGNYVDPPT